jgi:hypothetical protein
MTRREAWSAGDFRLGITSPKGHIAMITTPGGEMVLLVGLVIREVSDRGR